MFFGGFAGALAARGAVEAGDCACAETQTQTAREPVAGTPWTSGAHDTLLARVKVTNMKVFGVPTPGGSADRPCVFVKLETSAGLAGWGEATLEGKACAVMGCLEDFRDFVVGADPIQVEHHWQSLYVHSFYRAGPVIGSAISGIDQALWDLRGKILGLPVYQLLGGPFDAAGVRGYYHAGGRTREELARLRETAESLGVTCFKTGPAARTFEWIDTHQKIEAVVKHLQMLREGLGPDLDIAIDFHAKA
ncbi:MAG: galactonate dehydratase, partial [Acidobacteria bacterium]|nr:galactonate dehydratase [Acidobacteriota bacterium]